MDITIVTSTKKNKEAKFLLKAFNFPLNKQHYVKIKFNTTKFKKRKISKKI